jgi:hypothetical protein
MARGGASSERLRRHIESTYMSMRVGVALIGAALPVVLWVGALLLEGASLQASMSAYYYTGMRDVFVGALFAIGVALYLYKGFSAAENAALSLAGVLAVVAALFPTGGERILDLDVHAVAATLFFVCLAYVSVFRAGDTLSLIRDTRRARALLRVYRGLGLAMLASPFAALAAERVLRPPGGEPSIVFFAEAFGAWAFAAYWLVKSWELAQTSADRAVALGIVEPSTALERAPIPGRLVQTAPLDRSVEELRRELGIDAPSRSARDENRVGDRIRLPPAVTATHGEVGVVSQRRARHGRRRLSLAVAVLVSVVVLIAAGVYVWTQLARYEAFPEAIAVAAGTERVRGWYVFAPEGSPDAGFVFYPGGLVDAAAYAPLMQRLADGGVLSVIVPMPLELAVFGIDRAAAVIAAHPHVTRWVIGGHSLGGAMASQFVRRSPQAAEGLVLLASYPAAATDLSELPIRAVSVYGTEDGLTAPEAFEASLARLPPGTELVVIDGGNHAGFGHYGPQGGDGVAAIDREEQQRQTSEAVLAFLNGISGR